MQFVHNSRITFPVTSKKHDTALLQFAKSSNIELCQCTHGRLLSKDDQLRTAVDPIPIFFSPHIESLAHYVFIHYTLDQTRIYMLYTYEHTCVHTSSNSIWRKYGGNNSHPRTFVFCSPTRKIVMVFCFSRFPGQLKTAGWSSVFLPAIVEQNLV